MNNLLVRGELLVERSGSINQAKESSNGQHCRNRRRYQTFHGRCTSAQLLFGTIYTRSWRCWNRAEGSIADGALVLPSTQFWLLRRMGLVAISRQGFTHRGATDGSTLRR